MEIVEGAGESWVVDGSPNLRMVARVQFSTRVLAAVDGVYHC